jgi:hypothetical protein
MWKEVSWVSSEGTQVVMWTEKSYQYCHDFKEDEGCVLEIHWYVHAIKLKKGESICSFISTYYAFRVVCFQNLKERLENARF